MIQLEEDDAMFTDDQFNDEEDQYFVGLEDLKNFHLMNEIHNMTVLDVRI